MDALALVDSPDHVCCRYRIRAFAPALAAGGVTLSFERLESKLWSRARQLQNTHRYGVVILQRKLLPRWQLDILRRSAARLVFDFDDAVLYRDSFDSRGPDSARRLARFRHTVQSADAVLAGNQFLADRARDAGARAGGVIVIPTCIEPERYAAASRQGEHALPELVWIGSSSTLQGLERERALWDQLARANPGLTWRFISDRFPRFDGFRIVPVPWCERTEATDLNEGDVGVSHIPDDLWSRGKCGLKVLQYMAAGLPVVANPVGVHGEMVLDGETGYLARTAQDWTAAIRSLRDPEIRTAFGRLARSRVAARYSISAWADTFVASVAGSGSASHRRERVAATHVGGAVA